MKKAKLLWGYFIFLGLLFVFMSCEQLVDLDNDSFNSNRNDSTNQTNQSEWTNITDLTNDLGLTNITDLTNGLGLTNIADLTNDLGPTNNTDLTNDLGLTNNTDLTNDLGLTNDTDLTNDLGLTNDTDLTNDLGLTNDTDLTNDLGLTNDVGLTNDSGPTNDSDLTNDTDPTTNDTVLMETNAPVVLIESPNNPDSFMIQTVLTGSVSDESEITGAKYYYVKQDGVLTNSGVLSLSDGAYSQNLVFPECGQYLLWVDAVDEYTNIGISEVIHLDVDSPIPQLSIAGPVDGTMLTNHPTTIEHLMYSTAADMDANYCWASGIPINGTSSISYGFITNITIEISNTGFVSNLTADGISDWSLENVFLDNGVNTITVIAYSDTGKNTTNTVQINFYMHYHDIIFILDDSGSIGSVDWNVEKDYVREMIGALMLDPYYYAFGQGMPNNVNPRLRFGVIQFSSAVSTAFNFTDQQDYTVIADVIDDMEMTGGSTYTKKAVEQAIDDFDSYSDDNRKKTIFLITDSNLQSSQNPCTLVSQLQERGIEVYLILVGSAVSSSTLSCLVNDPGSDIILYDGFDLSIMVDGATGSSIFYFE